MGVCFWLDSSISVHTSVRRSVLHPMSRIRVLGQKSKISVFHCDHKRTGNKKPLLIEKRLHLKEFRIISVWQCGTKVNYDGEVKHWSHHLLQTAVHSVRTTDVETQQNCVWVTVAQGPHIVVVRRTLEGRKERLINVDERQTRRHLWFQVVSCAINSVQPRFTAGTWPRMSAALKYVYLRNKSFVGIFTATILKYW